MNPSVSQSMSRSTNRSDRPIRVSVCGFIMNNPARRPAGRPGRVVAAGGPTGRRCSDGTCVCGPKEWHTGRLSSLDIQVGTGRIHSSIDPSIHRSIDRSIDRSIERTCKVQMKEKQEIMATNLCLAPKVIFCTMGLCDSMSPT